MAPSRSTIYQTTLARDLVFDGVGLHSGERISLRVTAAPANTGLTFVVGPDAVRIPAIAGHVVSTFLATTLGLGDTRVSTVEHLLAALAGLGVDNAHIVVTGSELPIMDGSSAPFVRAIQEA